VPGGADACGRGSQIRQRPDYIVCLDDGRKFKSLKRHVAAFVNDRRSNIAKIGRCRATIDWWRPNYAAVRPALALKNGLGSNAAGAARAHSTKRCQEQAWSRATTQRERWRSLNSISIKPLSSLIGRFCCAEG